MKSVGIGFVAGINGFHPISALGRSIGAKELAVISSQPVMKHHGVVSCEIGNLPQRSEIDWNGILRPWVQINNAIVMIKEVRGKFPATHPAM